ncbi:hypothetical protein HDU77_005172 [Chytriomyces hyalinus]|nr:hypothetical protein HDU77_005172 [Chytriomyces hyalinus]
MAEAAAAINTMIKINTVFAGIGLALQGVGLRLGQMGPILSLIEERIQMVKTSVSLFFVAMEDFVKQDLNPERLPAEDENKVVATLQAIERMLPTVNAKNLDGLLAAFCICRKIAVLVNGIIMDLTTFAVIVQGMNTVIDAPESWGFTTGAEFAKTEWDRVTVYAEEAEDGTVVNGEWIVSTNRHIDARTDVLMQAAFVGTPLARPTINCVPQSIV